MKYYTQDKATGTMIDFFNSMEEAELAIIGYETEDTLDDNYTPDFYEIKEKIS